MTPIELTKRQEEIIRIVKEEGPITGEHIAEKLDLTRATLRPDLAILTMSGLLEARPRVGYFYSGKSTQTLMAERLSRIKVDDLKSLPIVISDKGSVYDSIVTMFTEDIGTLFVVDEEGCLEGAVSRKDLLKITVGGGDFRQMPVGMVMTRMPNIVTTSPEETVFLAARKLIIHQVDALPVVINTKTGGDREVFKVVGRFTKTNITRLFVELIEGH
ncbi:MAG: helix-turn-helix transcriptional regulator [Clostridia bacterium]|nr:helix-turn-helix transcriptional regulator [Clostridia bacterium]